MAPNARHPEGLTALLQALPPETMQQIGEALRGIDLGPLTAALPLGAPPMAGPRAALSRVDIVGALSGLSEVASYFGENPILGRKWTVKEVAGILGLLRSPNVQALVGTARAVPNLVRAGRQLAPLLSALRGAKGGERSRRARGRRGPPSGSALQPVPVPAETAGEPGLSPTRMPEIRRFRFARPEGPPTVLEPWTGAD
ncbi:MAG TPA: hypothetical protein GXX28_04275 [Firmicutes bacterium]|nr:hypothetical protein [Bacillota bacterium]